jgi:adenylyl-sulfate kinase
MKSGSHRTEHRGVTLWFTGLPCSGKSTIAQHVDQQLRHRGYKVEVLDGDAVRQNLTKGLGFSRQDRDENIRRIGFVCHLLTRNGVFAISAAISPYRAVRDEVRQLIGSYLEIYVKCPVELCAHRDVKGMYKKALAGEIEHFTGVSDPYEEPLNPDLILRTDTETPEQSAARVLGCLAKNDYLPKEEFEAALGYSAAGQSVATARSRAARG